MNKNPKINRKLYIISIILAVFVLTTSIGYGLFSKSLSIHGVATTLDYYSGTKLPHTPIKRDTNRNLYYTSNYDDGYTYMTSASVKYVYGLHNALVSENWNNDTYTITFDKGMLGAFQNKEITYTISFSNPTALSYTEGVVTTTPGNVLSGSTVSTASGTTTDIQNASATLSTSTLAPSNNVTVTLSMTLGTIDFNEDSVVKARVGYRLYADNGNSSGMRYFNFVVKYDSSIQNTSIIDTDDLLSCYDSSNGAKVSNGYALSKYPYICYDRSASPVRHDKIVTDLKANLEPGATYKIISDYEVTVSGSAGKIVFRSSSGVVQDSGYSNKGLRYCTFSLTQEQIDSIDRIYFYGNASDGLFTFIRIIKISD